MFGRRLLMVAEGHADSACSLDFRLLESNGVVIFLAVFEVIVVFDDFFHLAVESLSFGINRRCGVDEHKITIGFACAGRCRISAPCGIGHGKELTGDEVDVLIIDSQQSRLDLLVARTAFGNSSKDVEGLTVVALSGCRFGFANEDGLLLIIIVEDFASAFFDKRSEGAVLAV